jgi:hypothetical protein
VYIAWDQIKMWWRPIEQTVFNNGRQWQRKANERESVHVCCMWWIMAWRGPKQQGIGRGRPAQAMAHAYAGDAARLNTIPTRIAILSHLPAG